MLVPFHYSVCRFLFSCAQNKQIRMQKTPLPSAKQRTVWDGKPAKQNCHILFASDTNYRTNLVQRSTRSHCCLLSVFASSVHDSFETICKFVHTLDSLGFFSLCFVFHLFSQSKERVRFANSDELGRASNLDKNEFRESFFAALCCALCEFVLYFSVDFLVSLRLRSIEHIVDSR